MKWDKIDCVVVVEKCVDYTNVIVDIMKALATLLKIEYNCINVFSME